MIFTSGTSSHNLEPCNIKVPARRARAFPLPLALVQAKFELKPLTINSNKADSDVGQERQTPGTRRGGGGGGGGDGSSSSLEVDQMQEEPSFDSQVRQ